MGSVSPLVAIYEEVKKREGSSQFLFLGTKAGPEKQSIESYKIPFRAIASGKLRRYFDWHNFLDPFKILGGFFQSLLIIMKFKPDIVIIAGAFVGVPVAYAAWLLRVPVLIHQQDIVPGLANKLMANVSTKISVSFEISLKDFSPHKTVLTGNPVRREFYSGDCESSRAFFKLREDLPAVLILGGGTGAIKINELVAKSISQLTQFAQVIHITGKGKSFDVEAENYLQFEFLTHEMLEALCAADLVISRAGISTLSELIIMKKPTILIPMPRSHQEDNARYFQKHDAVIVLSEDSLTPQAFADVVKGLVGSEEEKDNLAKKISEMMPNDGAKRVVDLIVNNILKK